MKPRYLIPVVAIAAVFAGIVVVNAQTPPQSTLDKVCADIDADPGYVCTTEVPTSTTTVAPATTLPASTTSTAASTTTTSSSTTITSSTTTTLPPSTTTTVPPAPGCGLASPAFCETFDAAAGNGGRSGDLNPELWGVSRAGMNNTSQNQVNRVSVVQTKGCGADTAWVAPPGDVRVCGGRMTESVNDAGFQSTLATYPKQPFNFAGRTGTVVFDVTDDTQGSHAAWPEFWITAKPYPANSSEIAFQVPSIGQDAIGFQLAGSVCPFNANGAVGVDKVSLSQNYNFTEPAFQTVSCLTPSAGVGAAMDHFEFRVSTTRIEVWGSDPGSSTLRQLTMVPNLNLDFSQGLVWLTDTHYNAKKSVEPCECGTQVVHTFQWDNLGFDGPKTYRDLSFDVHDAHASPQVLCDTTSTWTVDAQTIQSGHPCWNSENEGYAIGGTPVTLSTDPVFRRQTPTGALVTFNSYSWDPQLPSVSLNGGAFVANPWPYVNSTAAQNGAGGFAIRSYAMVVPLASVHDGVNTLAFTTTGGQAWVSNVNLILVAGAPVP